MKRFKKSFTTLTMAAMVAITAAMPVSASSVSNLHVFMVPGFMTQTDTAYDLYGTYASVYINNEGYNATDAVVTYELFDFNWNVLAEGTLYSDYWVSYYDYREDKTFTGNFETDTGGFHLRIDCSINGLACDGRATIEVTD